MGGLDPDGDDGDEDEEDGEGGNGRDKKDKKDKKNGPPDHANGWGPGGNPEGTDDD